jgi:hypothetical protein
MDTSTFLDKVRDIIQLPPSDEDWTDTRILLEGTQALYDRFTQPIQVLRSGYWLHRTSITLTQGQSFYSMPPRAIVQGLEKIELSTDQGVTWYPLNILTDFETFDYVNSTQLGQPQWFSLEANGVTLYPTPSSGFVLRMSYYLRPSQLMAANAGGVIMTINATSFIVAGDPTGMLTTIPGVMDIVNTGGCAEVAVPDFAFTAITALGANLWRIDFASGTDVSRVAIGMVVRPSDQSDQLPLPQEMHNALVSWVGAVILAEKGDLEKAAVFSGKAENIISRVVDMATPRIKTRPYVFKTRNTYLRRRLGNGYGWR